MLDLTTLPRLKDWIDQDSNSGTSRPGAEMQMAQIISDISEQIAEHCDCSLLVDTYTERHSLAVGQRMIFPRNRPVFSVSSVYHDAMGFFQPGSAAQLFENSDWMLDPAGDRINLLSPWPSLPDVRCLEVIYVGGYAYSPNVTVYAATVSGTTPAAGDYELADGRKLTVVGFADGNLTFVPLSGSFRKGQSFAISGATVTLGAPVRPSVINDHPALEMACLMQCAYEWERRKSMGRTATTIQGSETRYTAEYKLLPGVVEKLVKYKHFNLGF